MYILFRFKSIFLMYFLSFLIFLKFLHKSAGIRRDLNSYEERGMGTFVAMATGWGHVPAPMNTHCHLYLDHQYLKWCKPP